MKNGKVKMLLAVFLTAVMITACGQKEENDGTADAAVESEQNSEDEEAESETVTPELDEEETENGEDSSVSTGYDSGSSTNSSKSSSTGGTRPGSEGSSGSLENSTASESRNESKSDSSVDASGNSDSSTQNAADDGEQNGDSSEADGSATTEGVKAKVKMYEGEYFDEILYTYVDPEVEWAPYCEFHISNVTDTSFDFEIYEVGELQKRTLIFKKHTAVFTGDGMQAVYNGNEYTLSFSFPDDRHAYPDVVDMRVSGFAPVEGRTYVNNMVPGHEFG